MRRLKEMSNEQRRQLVDVEQAYTTLRETKHQFLHSYKGPYAASMRWVKVNGKEYLYRTYHNVKKSLGPRSPETEQLKTDYMRQRNRLRARASQLQNRLKEMAPVNQALRLGRVPALTAKIIRSLDAAGLMSGRLFVVGTNALFAYEARAGIVFDSGMLNTGDTDFLLDARQNLGLALLDVNKEGVIGLLQKVDRSFVKDRPYRASNDNGFQVDLICPQDKAFLRSVVPNTAGTAPGDLEAAPIQGLQWLVNAPKFEAVVVGEDGLPLLMPCIDPRVFAMHKLWVSERDDREAIKRQRDRDQAIAVAALCNSYFKLPFSDPRLKALPDSIRGLGAKLDEQARGYFEVEDSDIKQRGW